MKITEIRGLSYGLGEFVRITSLLEDYGFDRAFAFTFGGHPINLHIGGER